MGLRADVFAGSKQRDAAIHFYRSALEKLPEDESLAYRSIGVEVYMLRIKKTLPLKRRFELRLFVACMAVCCSAGCGNGSKIEQLQKGAQHVHVHAKEIEAAAETNSSQVATDPEE